MPGLRVTQRGPEWRQPGVSANISVVSETEKTPIDRALELFVFAPVGVALTAREALPDLIERGRQQVTGQVTMAKVMGQFAVRQGRVEAEKVAGRVIDQATGVLEDLGLVPGSGNGTAPVVRPTPPTGASPATTQTRAASRPATSGPGAGELAIPDYDSLSASQVVPRLSGLSVEELEAVREYEAAHRARKTILNRVAQLQS